MVVNESEALSNK